MRIKPFNELKVSVIGGAGHVGLPFSIVVANQGAGMVYGIDLDSAKCHRLNGGEMIYVEEGGEDAIKQALAKGNLEFTVDGAQEYLKQSDVIAIMIGTPVDAEGNPRLDDLFDYIDKTLIPVLQYRTQTTDDPTLILLRSTVNPGTTELVRDRIARGLSDLGFSEFVEKVVVAFAPERVAQGRGIIETRQFPQIVGIDRVLDWYSDTKKIDTIALIRNFFDNIAKETIFMNYKESELAKLMTNMYRYVNFALANEFSMIAHHHGSVNIDHVIESINKDYPRMNLPKPGPNVGGPCLFKDGKFLTSGIPYGDLVNTAFLINEGYPQFVFDQIKSRVKRGTYAKVLILGATFKKDSDDIRNSLSFKFAKICRQNGVDSVFCDPNWKTKDPRNQTDFQKHLDDPTIGAIVIMTPHTIFKKWIDEDCEKDIQTYWGSDLVIPEGKEMRVYTLVDIWKLTERAKRTKHGITDLHILRDKK